MENVGFRRLVGPIASSVGVKDCLTINSPNIAHIVSLLWVGTT